MDRDYIFHESTTSICKECLKTIPAKIILKENKVYLKKSCQTHGEQEELLEEDQEYFLKRREYDKPGTISKTQTKINKGCPFDCGLCPAHDQHTCIGLIEVTNNCDLKCPICYAKSGTGEFLDIKKIDEMLDFLTESEGGEAEILQISGGEPTTHPKIIDIIKLARSKKINYIMLNTNGLRISEDEEFVKELSQFKGKFEIYLQFDGFKKETHEYFRGRDISKIKEKAIQNLTKHKIPITLVTTLKEGINDKEIGEIIKFGMETTGIRGVNLQPVAYFGRINKKDISNRITLTGTIKRIEEQLPDIFEKGDIVPLPCNVERVAVTYMAKIKDKFIPVTRKLKVKSYLPIIDNTFMFDADKIIKNKSKEILTPTGCCSTINLLKDVRNIIPLSFAFKSKEEKLRYIDENTFRISISSFIDIYNFDLKSMQKECVHIITPDLKKIPFSSYNMFHRK